MRVLVVEDDDVVAQMMVEALGLAGHVADRVCDHAEAEQIVARGEHEVCLVNGFQSVFDITEDERRHVRALAAHLPVVLTPGHVWASRRTAAELEVLAIVPKPFDLTDLLAAVASAEPPDAPSLEPQAAG